MASNILILFFITFSYSFSQTVHDSTSNIKIKDISQISISNGSVSENDDSSTSVAREIPQIIPDGEIKEKLSDIFSIGKIIWAIIFVVISFYVIKLSTKIFDKLSEKDQDHRY